MKTSISLAISRGGWQIEKSYITRQLHGLVQSSLKALTNPEIIEQGLDFINSHVLQDGPRTISTRLTHDAQISKNLKGIYFSREEILARYKQANYVDCKISGYPIYHPPDRLDIPCSMFMADVDKRNFHTNQEFESCSHRTLHNFNTILGCNPTLMWSGGGHHFIQPIEGLVFESIKEFNIFRQPSRRFMHFLEWLVTHGKADYNHWNTVSFRNMMLRIPGSYNKKYIRFDDSGNIVNIPPESRVRVIKEWDGKALRATEGVVTQYYIWLQDQDIRRAQQCRLSEESDLKRYGYSRFSKPIFYQKD